MQLLSRLVSATGLNRLVPSKKGPSALQSLDEDSPAPPQRKNSTEKRARRTNSYDQKVVTRAQAKRTISSLHALLGRAKLVLVGSRSSLPLPGSDVPSDPFSHTADFVPSLGPTADQNYFFGHVTHMSSNMLLPRGLPPTDPTIDVHLHLHRADTATSDVSSFHDHTPKRKSVHFTLA